MPLIFHENSRRQGTARVGMYIGRNERRDRKGRLIGGRNPPMPIAKPCGGRWCCGVFVSVGGFDEIIICNIKYRYSATLRAALCATAHTTQRVTTLPEVRCRCQQLVERELNGTTVIRVVEAPELTHAVGVSLEMTAENGTRRGRLNVLGQPNTHVQVLRQRHPSSALRVELRTERIERLNMTNYSAAGAPGQGEQRDMRREEQHTAR